MSESCSEIKSGISITFYVHPSDVASWWSFTVQPWRGLLVRTPISDLLARVTCRHTLYCWLGRMKMFCLVGPNCSFPCFSHFVLLVQTNVSYTFMTNTCKILSGLISASCCKSISAQWEDMPWQCCRRLLMLYLWSFHLGWIKVRFRIIYSKIELLYQTADSDMYVWTFALAEMWKQSSADRAGGSEELLTHVDSCRSPCLGVRYHLYLSVSRKHTLTLLSQSSPLTPVA